MAEKHPKLKSSLTRDNNSEFTSKKRKSSQKDDCIGEETLKVKKNMKKGAKKLRPYFMIPRKYREEIFHGRLRHDIKKALYSGLRNDPAINIKLSVDLDVFKQGLGNVVDGVRKRNKTVYKLASNRLIDNLLGEKWDERIFNQCGDYAFVIQGTVSYWLVKAKPLVEFKLVDDEYVKCEVEEMYFVVFTFVRGDGNRQSYKSF